MTDTKPDLGTIFRAGRVLLGAIVTRTGPRTPRRWRALMPVALIGALGVGAVAGASINGEKASDVPAVERAKIEAVVREYILAHPEIIPEAMEQLRSNQSAKAISDNRKDIETPYAGAWDGAANGDVTLVEFFDYSCGYCRAAAPDITRLLAEDKKLKVVYRELPILGDESVLAARVALLAADSGKYPAFHNAMYGKEEVTKGTILASAEKAGLDKAKVQAILSSRGSADEFAKNIGLAQALNARGTPLFIVGDQVMHGAVGYDELKAAIAKTRSSNKIG
ncbi:MAG TPA: DsbA family protein [Sphingobium sp.]|uniref:DsbA family protein n=1 Tax=Sphingobium sp. TaxID=1912891 RepID=UPI002ED2DB2C